MVFIVTEHNDIMWESLYLNKTRNRVIRKVTLKIRYVKLMVFLLNNGNIIVR